MEPLEKAIFETTIELLSICVNVLPQDVRKKIDGHQEKATSQGAKSELQAIIDNYSYAESSKIPMCQDTGLIGFDIYIGDDFPLRSPIEEIMRNAVKEATKRIPLRPNTVDLFDGNSGTNVGKRGYLPWFNWKLVPGNDLKIEAITKGGGSTNVAQLGLLSAARGLTGIKEFVIDSVIKAGFKACPPYVVGIGIGGGEEMCMAIAKKSLKRKLGERHPDSRIAELEGKFEEAINALDIGVMGKGNSPTALAVNIELAARHPASLPVGVVISCWALRRANATIKADGSVFLPEQ